MGGNLAPQHKWILMGNVYRPPEGSVGEAFELIGAALDEIDNITKFEVIVMGILMQITLTRLAFRIRKLGPLRANTNWNS